MKKLLLVVLPALMVLAGCSAPVKAEKESFVEDTLAHEELFGNPGLMQKDHVSRTISGVDTFDSGVPSIGVQTNDELADGFAIRFVSAVSIEDGDLASANLYWTRSIYNADFSAKKSEETIPVTKLYDRLASSGDPITIGDYNAENHTNYNYFAVYTVRKINKTNDANCVINACLNIGSASSKVLSTTVDQKTQFTFDKDDTGYFGVKKTASGFEKITKSSYTADDNYAQFEGINVSSSESFVLVNRVNSGNSQKFEVFGADKIQSDDFAQVGESKFAKPNTGLSNYNFFFYLSNGKNNANDKNKIYVQFAKTYFLQVNDNWLQKDGSNVTPRFAMYIVENSGTPHWYSMSLVEGKVYSCTVAYSDASHSFVIIFCRMNGGNAINEWSNKYNQTGDLSWQPTNNLYTVPDGEWDNSNNTHWSVR